MTKEQAEQMIKQAEKIAKQKEGMNSKRRAYAYVRGLRDMYEMVFIT